MQDNGQQSSKANIFAEIRNAFWNYPMIFFRIIKRLQRFKLISVSIIFVSMLGFLYIAIFIAIQNERGVEHTLYLGIIDINSEFNPIGQNNLSRTIDSLVYSKLFWLDNKNSPHPLLASSWEANSNNTSVTIHLNTNIHWQDGKPFIADDVVYSFNIEKKLKEIAFLTNMQMVKLDTHTVRVTISAIDVNLWEDLYWPVFPDHYVYSNYEEIGTGAYSLVKHDNNGYSLTANPSYFKGAPKIHTIIIKAYAKQSDLYAAYQSGDINSIEAYDPSYTLSTQGLNISKDTISAQPVINNFNALFFNVGRMQNADIRKALNYGINRNELAAVVPAGSLIDGPISKQSWAYNTNQNIPRYPYSRDQAFASFKSAGYTLQGNVLVDAKENQFSLTIGYLSDSLDSHIQKIIEINLQNLGIKVLFKEYNPADWQNEILINKNFVCIYTQIQTGVDPDPFGLWSSDGQSNISSYTNKEVDRYLDLGRNSNDQGQRQRAYALFQQILMNDAPAVFLYSPNIFFQARYGIFPVLNQNIAFDTDIFQNIEKWSFI